MSRTFITVVLWLVSLSGAVLARDIYVDNVNGDDRNNGSQADAGPAKVGPLKTIGRALWIAEAGDRVVLAKNDEPYREMVCLIGPRNSGFQETPFTIEGNGAVLDGSAPINSEDWRHAMGDVFQIRFRYMAYPMLFEAEKQLPRAKIANEGELSKLQVGQWATANGKVYFRPIADRSFLTYPLAAASLATGITLFQVDNVVIRNLTVQGYRIDGVSAPDAAEVVRLEKVVSRVNGRSGLSAGGTSKVIAIDSQMVDNGAMAVRMEGFCKMRLAGCLLAPQAKVERRGGTLMQE
jgi:hypothetical protein